MLNIMWMAFGKILITESIQELNEQIKILPAKSYRISYTVWNKYIVAQNKDLRIQNTLIWDFVSVCLYMYEEMSSHEQNYITSLYSTKQGT